MRGLNKKYLQGMWAQTAILFLLAIMIAVPIIASAGSGSFEDDSDGDPVFAGASIAICCGGFILSIVLAVWVYKDAEARGESGVMWLIIVLFTGIIGIIIWLVVRPKDLAPPPGAYQPPMYPPQAPMYQPPPQNPYPPQYPPQAPPEQPPQNQYPSQPPPQP